MRIKVKESVCLVIDFQEKLVPVMYHSDDIVSNARILLEGLKVLDVPRYVTQQYTKGLGETVEDIRKVLEEDTIEAPMMKTIEKIRFSAYEDVKHLVTGKKYVIVCGIEAHICVLQTVIDLKEAGYTPVLVADCISSRKVENCQFAIERARQEGAIITTYESILFELLEQAGTVQSKAIQKLIK